MRSEHITLGADVECFLMDEAKAAYVPCVGIMPGTKDKPAQVEGMPKGFCTQEDNVMLEWNIPPVTSAKAFCNNIKQMRVKARALLPPPLTTVYTESMVFEPKHLQSEQARTFGCDPDFDAYQGGAIRRMPEDVGESPWRGAGGHVHIGGDFQCPDFVVALFADLWLGVFAHGVQGCSERSKWYGKPGIFRPKPYGIEYRTLGSTWAGNNEATSYIAQAAMRCATFCVQEDASRIQEVFSNINWRRIHAYLSFAPDSAGRSRTRNQIIHEAQQQGLTL